MWGVVLFEDPTLASDLVLDTPEAVAGQPVTLSVDLAAGGEPVAEMKPVLKILEPTASVGELLSTGGQEPETSADDPASTGAALLQALLRDTPDALAAREVAVDLQGRDGFFTATFVPPVGGHYVVDLSLLAHTEKAGDFELHHRASFFAAVQPTASHTDVRRDGSRLVLTPASATELLGPGYEGRLWLIADREEPTAFVDRLDGTYEAALGELDTAFEVHFVPAWAPVDPDGPALSDDTLLLAEGETAASVPVLLGCSSIPTAPSGLGIAGLLVVLLGTARRRGCGSGAAPADRTGQVP